MGKQQVEGTMKKRIQILLPIAASLSLFSCILAQSASHFFNRAELAENVVRVELVYYDNPAARRIRSPRPHDIGLLPQFDFAKMEIRATMDEDMMPAFFRELSSVALRYLDNHLDSPRGLCIRLVYRNGDFLVFGILGVEYSAIFDSNGNVIYLIGSGLYAERYRGDRRPRNMLYRFFGYEL